jgi:hypothetical protein
MRRLVPALLVLVGASLVGCQSNPTDPSYNMVKRNLTPELQTLSESSTDVDRNLSVNFNQDLRMISSDLGRAFYTDRPSYLSPMPVVATGGQPR